MKISYIILALILIKVDAFGNEWIELTPFGGQISYSEYLNKGKIYYLGGMNDTVNIVEGVTSWYFYNGCTIGKNKTKKKGVNFFVGDEINNQLYVFKSEETFNSFTTNHKLNPLITRWHSDSWSNTPLFYVNEEDFIIGAILWGLIAPFIVFSLIILMVIYWYKYKENPFANKSAKKIFKFFVGITFIFYVINYLLNEFPQSV